MVLYSNGLIENLNVIEYVALQKQKVKQNKLQSGPYLPCVLEHYFVAISFILCWIK